MIKLRITGLPDELECFLDELRKHFPILNESKSYKNNSSRYVRKYVDVEQTRRFQDNFVDDANMLIRALICKNEPYLCEWCDERKCNSCKLFTENDDDECNFSLNIERSKKDE